MPEANGPPQMIGWPRWLPKQRKHRSERRGQTRCRRCAARTLCMCGAASLGLGMVLILCLAVKPDLSMAVVLSTFRVGSDPLDVVISEVAWMGTAHSAYDEWIELRNNTSEPVSLEDWRLTDGDDLDIALEGVIPAQGCLLLERTDDTTVSDIPADLIYTGSLHDSGEVLTLTNETGAVIDAVDAADGWPAGSRVLRQTMERVDPRTDGGTGNWVTNSGVYRNGRDAGGGPVYGTPREPNSASRNRGEEGAILISAVQ